MTTLTVKSIAQAALKAYDEKRLSAQGPTPCCAYRDPTGRPCAVGAGLPDDLAAQLDVAIHGGSMPIEDAAYAGYVSIARADAFQLRELQKAHDAWANAVKWNPDLASQREADFLTIARSLAA